MPLKNYRVPKEKAIDSKEGEDQNRETDECQMAPATAEIGDAQDLELDGGSPNCMTLAEVVIPAPIPGAISTIVGLMIAAGRDRGEEEVVINRAATSSTPLISHIS
ncbi:MAG: hypothetical protein U9N61_04270 [Euryarchaeota archaeon]|nr:hypothetical protein [Euryarchaeota archaeon]